MGQDTYNIDLASAMAGQIADSAQGVDICTCYATESILPGLVVEVIAPSAGDVRPRVRLPQGTGANIAKAGGVSVLTVGKEPSAAYAIGDLVPVMRRGHIWAVSIAGSATAFFDAAKVSHSSTIATDRGKLTDAASSAVAGTEVDATQPLKFLGDKDANGLVKVEVAIS